MHKEFQVYKSLFVFIGRYNSNSNFGKEANEASNFAKVLKDKLLILIIFGYSSCFNNLQCL